MTPQAGLILTILIVGAFVVATLIRNARRHVTVYAPDVALLYRDGAFVRELGPGRHEWIDWRGRTATFTVSLAELPVALPEITVISQDQFSFRLTLSPTLRVLDARGYREATAAPDPRGFPPYASNPTLAPAVSAAAIDAAGRLTMAALIAEPAALADAILARVRDVVPGAAVTSLLVTAITLPPEVRKMFTDVERAKLEAAASVERARGEHAALRVLANAARLARDNPELVQLRLLQSIESSKGATTIVMGGATLPTGIPN